MDSENEKTKLLLVDDAQSTRRSLAKLFHTRGYTVEEAGTAEDALKILQQSDAKITFVLLDQVLEGVPDGGMHAMEQISKLRLELFIVMYTADPTIEDTQKWQALSLGAHRYIRKTDPTALLKDIDEFIHDMRDLQELTNQFKKITEGRLKMASALIGMDNGVTLIDKDYRVWFANKAQKDIVCSTDKGIVCASDLDMVGAPCWVRLHRHEVEHGPCTGCIAKAVFDSEKAETCTYLNRLSSGKLGWIQVQTTPIFSEITDSTKKVIGAKKVTQKLQDGVVQQMELKERLLIIAKGIVFDGYGRARIYCVNGSGRLECITAATGADSNTDKNYRDKVTSKSFPKHEAYIQQAINERKGTLYKAWIHGEHADAKLQLGIEPPWIDLPIWNDNQLIGWLGVDLVHGKKSELTNEDVEALLPYAEEIKRAFLERQSNVASGGDDALLRNKIAHARMAVAGVHNADEAIQIILETFADIVNCCKFGASGEVCRDIQIRIRENGHLVLLKRLNQNDGINLGDISETDTESLSAHVVRSGNALYLDDYKKYQERIANGERLPRGKFAPAGNSIAILPLQIELTCFGTLRIEPSSVVAWDQKPGIKALFVELASLAALLVRDIVINRKIAHGKAAAERELALAFGAIHGVKGPVQAVRNYLGLITDLHKKGELTLEKTVEYAKFAGLSLTRVERLANRLLRLVGPRRGRVSAQDITDLIQKCLAENKIFYPDMKFQFNGFDGVPTVFIEPEEFVAMIDELITNSARATAMKGQVKINAYNRDALLVITCEDDGPGVKPDEISRIFERWYTTFPGGTGLGLSFVRKVMEDLSGTARAEAGNPGLRIVLNIPKNGPLDKSDHTDKI